MTVLLMGILMAFTILFAARRQENVATLVSRLDASQTAYEVLSAATKRVQTIYANESSCDPKVLNSRLSRLEKLPADPNSAGLGSNLFYAVAQTKEQGAQLSSTERFNLCTPVGSTGCRQLAVSLENLVYVVTVGQVVGTDLTQSKDCPQDANVRVSVAINGSVFSQWSTLINVCTLSSCVGDSFTGVTVAVPGGSASTSSCAYLPSRYYGSFTEGSGALSTVINTDDLRWARRYLETGGADVGETTYLVEVGRPANEVKNGSCTEASSASQCKGKNCIPAFDLNRDKTNNEADLAILELYLRGYLLSLPVTYLN